MTISLVLFFSELKFSLVLGLKRIKIETTIIITERILLKMSSSTEIAIVAPIKDPKSAEIPR